jgi:TolB-like protein
MVVEGTVQHKNGAVHITMDLVDSKRVRQIGAIDLQSDAGDMAQLENEAITHLARLMKVRVPEVFPNEPEPTTPTA